jgi:glycosyltransferase involved in cell wall biosynthesis
LFIGSDGSGCLDEVGIPTKRYWYRRTPYRFLTLFTYLFSQVCLLIKLLRSKNIDRDAVIYVNTLLPFGAALYGWITGRMVVYHLHEVSVSSILLRWFLITVVRHTAQRLIYVSDFHRACLPIRGLPAKTVYNALDSHFIARAHLSTYKHRHDGFFRVLMLSSVRDYKGVPEFIALASRLEGRADIRFDFVANDDEVSIKRYFATTRVPSNMIINPCISDTTIHYAKASLVLNLSRPDKRLETFGLTILEAMTFGIPVIAPPAGGPIELVSEGVDGFMIDCRNVDLLSNKVLLLADDEALCLKLSSAARQKATRFAPDIFARTLRKALTLQAHEESTA